VFCCLYFTPQLGLSPLLFCGDIAGETQSETDNVLPAVAEETPEEVCASLRASLEESAASLSASSEEGMAQRRCVIEKGPLGYGLEFDCVQHIPGTIVSQVQKITHTGSNFSHFKSSSIRFWTPSQKATSLSRLGEKPNLTC